MQATSVNYIFMVGNIEQWTSERKQYLKQHFSSLPFTIHAKVFKKPTNLLSEVETFWPYVIEAGHVRGCFHQ